MSILDRISRALVIAPHPDDEVLGCGGTIARLAKMGCEVHVAIVTRGRQPRFDVVSVEAVQGEAREAHELLGVKHTHWLDLPAAELDQMAHADLNRALGTLLAEVTPDTVFLPFVGDLHLDHQLVFTSGLVAARPTSHQFPQRIYAYETLSETNWHAPYLAPAFQPNLFVDIAEFWELKVKAFRLYRSQVRAFPHERSVEGIEALAKLRGAAVHRAAAEGFVLVREVG
jgi:LmbE family N-acetylglucosaminyl deacetylase